MPKSLVSTPFQVKSFRSRKHPYAFDSSLICDICNELWALLVLRVINALSYSWCIYDITHRFPRSGSNIQLAPAQESRDRTRPQTGRQLTLLWCLLFAWVSRMFRVCSIAQHVTGSWPLCKSRITILTISVGSVTANFLNLKENTFTHGDRNHAQCMLHEVMLNEFMFWINNALVYNRYCCWYFS